MSSSRSARLASHPSTTERRPHVPARCGLPRGPSAAPVAVIDTDPGTLARVLWHGRRIAGAIRSGDLRIEGDRAAGRRFLALFPAPRPAEAAA